MSQPSPTRRALETKPPEIKASMHGCLQLPEILSLIFWNCTFRDDDGMRQGLGTLARLARTCKAFHEASVPIIWDEVPGLHVLVTQFTEDSISWDKDHGVLSFKKASKMESLPISRIQWYCSHVRILLYNTKWRLHHAILLALYDSACNKMFFPKLEQVSIPCIIDRPLETIFYPALVMSPKLQRISFVANGMYFDVDPPHEGTMGMAEQAREALGKRIASIAHQITTYMPSDHFGHFPMGLKQYVWTPAIHDLVNHLSDSFTTFNAGLAYVEIAALQGLTRLSNLTTLSLTVLPPHIAASTCESFPLTFPALFTLNIIFTVFPMSLFFERLEAPALENLRMEVWDDTETEFALQGLHQDENGEQITGVASIPIRFTLLKNLQINVHHIVPGEIPLYFSLHPSGLRAFAELKHLESLCIDPCTVDALMDNDIIDAFKAWPKLKSFILQEDAFWTGISQTDLTLGGIHAALEYCPDLTVLGLPCDARMIPTFPVRPLPSLEARDFYNSPIVSGRECAQWLHEAYPNLSQIIAFSRYRQRIITLTSADRGPVPPHALEGALMMDQWNDVCSYSDAVIPMK